jgi:hypothetical protein
LISLHVSALSAARRLHLILPVQVNHGDTKAQRGKEQSFCYDYDMRDMTPEQSKKMGELFSELAKLTWEQPRKEFPAEIEALWKATFGDEAKLDNRITAFLRIAFEMGVEIGRKEKSNRKTLPTDKTAAPD